jgi:hypothetical protein
MTKDYQDIMQYISGISYGINTNRMYKKNRLYKKRLINEKPNKVYPICAICGNNPEYGLYDGFRINGKFICSKCEAELIGCRKEEEYDITLKAVKNVLFG